MTKNDSALFYTCSLIEFIGRKCHQNRGELADKLGAETVSRIYRNADVFHCEVIDSVADRFIEMRSIPEGTFDNVTACKYNIPDYWTIGAVYARPIEDVCDEITAENILAIYSSWISDAISNYNTDFYYQPRDYIKECYLAGKVL